MENRWAIWVDQWTPWINRLKPWKNRWTVHMANVSFKFGKIEVFAPKCSRYQGKVHQTEEPKNMEKTGNWIQTLIDWQNLQTVWRAWDRHQDLLHRTEYLTSLVSGISEVEERDPSAGLMFGPSLGVARKPSACVDVGQWAVTSACFVQWIVIALFITMFRYFF